MSANADLFIIIYDTPRSHARTNGVRHILTNRLVKE